MRWTATIPARQTAYSARCPAPALHGSALGAVVDGDGLRVREVQRNGPGHAQLVKRDVGVAADDGSRREVHTLAHQVASHPTLLAL